MKTLTFRTYHDLQKFPKPKLIVDGKTMGVLENEKTQYFEIPENAKSICIDFFFWKTNKAEVSENEHHAFMIVLKKAYYLNIIFALVISFIFSYIINYFDLNFFYSLLTLLFITGIYMIIMKSHALFHLEKIDYGK